MPHPISSTKSRRLTPRADHEEASSGNSYRRLLFFRGGWLRGRHSLLLSSFFSLSSSFSRSPRISTCNYCSPHGLCPFFLFASSAPDLLSSSLPSFPRSNPLACSRCRNYCQYSGLTWRDTLGPCAWGQASGLAEITVGRRLAEERITCTRAGAFRARILACTRARTRRFLRRFAVIDNFAVFHFEGCPIILIIDSQNYAYI